MNKDMLFSHGYNDTNSPTILKTGKFQVLCWQKSSENNVSRQKLKETPWFVAKLLFFFLVAVDILLLTWFYDFNLKYLTGFANKTVSYV